MKNIAVIGAGISGLAAAYLLSRKHRVTLFEREPRLGGHTHTIVVADREQGAVPLDTGFLVHNDLTYPNLVRLFAEIGIETQPSDMSFSVTCPDSGFEYSSRGAAGFFAQPRNVLRFEHYLLLRDILRFNREAITILDRPDGAGVTLGDYLDAHRYGEGFVQRYLVPMTSAIWSASFEGIRQFPAQMLVRFMHNHGMLSVDAQPLWRVVRGGSHTYIPELAAPISAVCLGARLQSVTRSETHVTMAFEDRPPQRFDDVVFACHGDQVLGLLLDPTDAEREVFRAFTTTANDTWLHTDRRWLPRTPRARASWNYRLGAADEAPPSVTYHLNRLQGLQTSTDYCVTLNPREPIAAEHVIRRMHYRHPQFTLGAVRAQRRWKDVSGVGRTHYCGAYWRYGFHEDGLMSAIRVADSLGVRW
jgi:predicted NAD/FAD-binding protein